MALPVFANPWLLLLLLLVPALVWWWYQHGTGALSYPDTSLLSQLPAGRSGRVRWAGAALRAGGLILIVIALAGPRWPDAGTRIPTEGIAIAMVVDVSGSMAERDFTLEGQSISRLEAVKKVFRLFAAGGQGPQGEELGGRANDLMALVTFATRPEAACPLTLSHDVLLQILDAQEPRTVPTEARTNIGDAIAWGLQRLQASNVHRRVMVLLSDGEHNVEPPALKPRQAAQLAGNLGVPIYAIDASGDSEKGGVHEDGSVADRLAAKRALQDIASISKGRYFRAGDSAALVAAYAEIDRLERQAIQSFQYRRYYEMFPWFGLGALLLWVAITILEATIWQKIP
jgi:Ca-activated chloride channel family protein